MHRNHQQPLRTGLLSVSLMQIKPAEVSAILREQAAGNQSEADLRGTVLQVDGIAHIYGLSNVQAGELIEFENGAVASR